MGMDTSSVITVGGIAIAVGLLIVLLGLWLGRASEAQAPPFKFGFQPPNS